LSKETDLPIRKSEEIIDKVFDTMSKALIAGDRIEIRGFGALSVRKYAGYTGRNPKTGAKTVVEAKRLPFFKVGKDFREGLNKKSTGKRPKGTEPNPHLSIRLS
jgi:integration host factor subunit beta